MKGITKEHLSANDLTEAQAQKLIAGMNQRIAAQAASVNEPMPMDMADVEELAHQEDMQIIFNCTGLFRQLFESRAETDHDICRGLADTSHRIEWDYW